MRKTHWKFANLLVRITHIYKRTGDMILIGKLMDEYNGPVWTDEPDSMGESK